jgi:hypothetical protein
LLAKTTETSVRPTAFKMPALLGLLFLGSSKVTTAAEPLFAVKCSEPEDMIITLVDGKVQKHSDAISNQSYTIALYRPDGDGNRRAAVIAEGKNNLNEQGSYRVYGPHDRLVIDVTIIYDDATWTYSLFPKDHLLFIHSTKVGIIGNPTAHLLVAGCS